MSQDVVYVKGLHLLLRAAQGQIMDGRSFSSMTGLEPRDWLIVLTVIWRPNTRSKRGRTLHVSGLTPAVQNLRSSIWSATEVRNP